MTSQATIVVKNPFDEAQLKTLAYMDEAAASAALDRAYKLFCDRGAWLDAPTRIEVLERFAALLTSRAEVLLRQAVLEGGKPLKDSRIEVQRAIEGVKVAVREISALHGTEIPMRLNSASAKHFAHSYREPRGVVLAISAFNHPLNLIIHQVIPAIAAGCPTLVKPALTTPLSCMHLVALLGEAGLPEGWCQCLLVPDALAEKLVSDVRVSFLSFIGSAAVGWHLRGRLAPGAACTLEHGGVAPALVDASADVEGSIPRLTRAGFTHAGQVCVSVQRIYLQHAIAQRFIGRFVASVRALKVGNPLHPDTEVGPLISRHEVERVDAWVQEAIHAGAQLLCGGHKLSPTLYAPTVLLNPPDEARVSRQEIFGPVVAVYTFASLDEAIRRANAPESFFQASVFTSHLDTALYASRKLHGMAVMVNEHTAFRVDWMPFGGHRQSGMGLGGIGNSMRDMTVERMVVFRSEALAP